MLHALIIDLGSGHRRGRSIRSSLEARGWETSTFRHLGEPRGDDLARLRARWTDCDLAVVIEAPRPLIRSLQRGVARPVVHLAHHNELRRGRHARILG